MKQKIGFAIMVVCAVVLSPIVWVCEHAVGPAQKAWKLAVRVSACCALVVMLAVIGLLLLFMGSGKKDLKEASVAPVNSSSPKKSWLSVPVWTARVARVKTL